MLFFTDVGEPSGFTCVSCKRYFNSHYFDTGLGGYYDRETGEIGGDATDGDVPYYYCAYCDRKGGDEAPFYWDDKVPWPYPEDITTIPT